MDYSLLTLLEIHNELVKPRFSAGFAIGRRPPALEDLPGSPRQPWKRKSELPLVLNAQ